MAAKFGATIIPFAAVGADESVNQVRGWGAELEGRRQVALLAPCCLLLLLLLAEAGP
jgi:hypothetical protein